MTAKFPTNTPKAKAAAAAAAAQVPTVDSITEQVKQDLAQQAIAEQANLRSEPGLIAGEVIDMSTVVRNPTPKETPVVEDPLTKAQQALADAEAATEAAKKAVLEAEALKEAEAALVAKQALEAEQAEAELAASAARFNKAETFLETSGHDMISAIILDMRATEERIRLEFAA